MQVLVLLAQHHDEVVSRDDMIAACWRGMVVGEDAIQRCIGRLRKVTSTVGGFEVQTINRVGYRLRAVGGDTLPPEAAPVAARDARPTIKVAGIAAFGAEEGAGQYAQMLTQDLASALSLHRDLHVVVSHALLNPAHDPSAPGLALPTHYVVQGSLRRAADHHRIVIQLLEEASGRIAWNYNVQVQQLDFPSEDVVIDIAGRLFTEVMRHVADKVLRKADELTAWEAVVRASTYYQRISLRNLPFAVAESRRAVQLDPNYAAAHAALAHGLAASYEVGGARDPALAQEAQVHCDIALTLDSSDPAILAEVANALSMTTRPLRGMELALRAVELAPTDPYARLNLARRYLYLGQPAEALACIAEQERLAPLFPWQYFVAFNKGLAYFMAGELGEAVAALDKAALLNPDYPYTWLAKAVLSTMLERPEEAIECVRCLQRLEGRDCLDLQLARIGHSYPDGPERAAIQHALATAWRLAEEGRDAEAPGQPASQPS